MITLTTEQAQQIEEVLEELCGSIDFYNKYGPDWTHKDGTESFNVSVLLDIADDISKAIIALREALANTRSSIRSTSEYSEQAEQEPVAEWEKLKDPQTLFVNLNRGFPAQLTHDHLLHLLNKTEQAEQEPVIGAYEVVNEKGDEWSLVYPAAVHRYKSIPEERITQTFYAAPVRTKDLTDDELLNELKMLDASTARLPIGFKLFARAVIAVDREKNKCLKVK